MDLDIEIIEPSPEQVTCDPCFAGRHVRCRNKINCGCGVCLQRRRRRGAPQEGCSRRRSALPTYIVVEGRRYKPFTRQEAEAARKYLGDPAASYRTVADEFGLGDRHKVVTLVRRYQKAADDGVLGRLLPDDLEEVPA